MVATGAHMAIFTGRELALLSNLRSDWQNLYQQELARLQRNEDAATESQQPYRKPPGNLLCLGFQSLLPR
jgi:hypothetical protein